MRTLALLALLTTLLARSADALSLATTRHDVDLDLTRLGAALATALHLPAATSEQDTHAAGALDFALAESSVYVERSNAFHPARPSAFGAHLPQDGLDGNLFPLETLVKPGHERACKRYGDDAFLSGKPPTVLDGWIALIERAGGCGFVDKVLWAQEAGAEAVILADSSVDDGGARDDRALLTPWAPDAQQGTLVRIPSVFVARASYHAILDAFRDAQRQVFAQDLPRPLKVHLTAPTPSALPSSPLFDLLLVLLFLPSLLTLGTVILARIAEWRRVRAERAPERAVQQLRVITWGRDALPEKAKPTVDEDAVEAGEQTPLLSSNASTSATTAPPSPRPFLDRFRVAKRNDSTQPRMSHNFSSTSLNSPSEDAAEDASTEEDPIVCAICISAFNKGDKVLVLPCGHLYHQDEVTEWLTGFSRLCPICRASIVAPAAPARPSRLARARHWLATRLNRRTDADADLV